MDKWNPRYLAYCKATGNLSPDATLIRDRKRWPGGVMAGFTIWVQGRWNAWRQMTSYRGILCPEHHEAFDTWIDSENNR